MPRVMLVVLILSIPSVCCADAGAIAICRDGCGKWYAAFNWPSKNAAEEQALKWLKKNGHNPRILESSSKRYFVVAYTEGRKGVAWAFSKKNHDDALDEAIGHYRKTFGRQPHQFKQYDNHVGGDPVKGIID